MCYSSLSSSIALIGLFLSSVRKRQSRENRKRGGSILTITVKPEVACFTWERRVEDVCCSAKEGFGAAGGAGR